MAWNIFVFFFSVLRTFIYDPLVEWQRTKGRELLGEASKNKETGEVTNEEVSVLLGTARFWHDLGKITREHKQIKNRTITRHFDWLGERRQTCSASWLVYMPDTQCIVSRRSLWRHLLFNILIGQWNNGYSIFWIFLEGNAETLFWIFELLAVEAITNTKGNVFQGHWKIALLENPAKVYKERLRELWSTLLPCLDCSKPPLFFLCWCPLSSLAILFARWTVEKTNGKIECCVQYYCNTSKCCRAWLRGFALSSMTFSITTQKQPKI